MPKMVCGPKKKKSRNVPEKRRDDPKKRRDVPKKHAQLENDVLTDPLGVRGSNLVQQKGINAENGLQKKRQKKKERPEKTQGRPEKTHSTEKGRFPYGRGAERAEQFAEHPKGDPVQHTRAHTLSHTLKSFQVLR